ncbi:CaiB/BaiF CoA transferase family protein [Serinicoccus marinus]|uniref:CaiB/BaiF CoA transferase family protein n=1 Tax=Serinicoccus marinus TaxID=247333 RepID=UPI0024937A9F|nr:CoA transferase [Serinicoccus marinus]
MEQQPGQRQADSGGPLNGIVVLDLSRALSGPHAAMMLGDQGARVIKVEERVSGDQTRSWGPFVRGEQDDQDVSTYFLSCNRNKESITLDLKSEEGLATLRSLVRRADVLVENFRPGVLDRLGLDAAAVAELNPRLVLLSISGFGHDGPQGQRPGYDQIAQGEGGLMSVTGSGPGDEQRVGVAISDVLAGMYGAFGVVSALVERDRTGRGQIVRTSLLASVVGVHAFQGTRWTVAGEVPQPVGNHHPSIAPYGLFRCKDGGVQIACGTDAQWRDLCNVLGLDPRAEDMGSGHARVARRDRLVHILEEALSAWTAQDVLRALETAGVPAGQVRDLSEVYTWDQTLSQGLLVDVDHPQLGAITLPGPPLRFFSRTESGESEVTRRHHTSPPMLDEHGTEIRTWLEEVVD